MERYQALRPRQLFDMEIERLTAKGLTRYEHADRFRNNLPPNLFLFIPPQSRELDLDNLMDLIEINGIRGRNFLAMQGLKDIIEIPKQSYFMLDLENHRIKGDCTLLTVETDIIKRNRLPYTMWGGIIHAIVFPEILEDYDITYFIGSRHTFDYEGKSRVPFIRLHGNEPQLDSYQYLPCVSHRPCAPSCREIIS